MMLLPQDYIDRPQAFLKHTILETYLERLFMIIGQTETVINYVDCFAGPWSDENEELKDTSIGISINIMRKCVAALRKNHDKKVRFRALYIEKDKHAYARLKNFLNKQTDPSVEVNCLHGDYTGLLPDIMKWSETHFSFFFVDPKGWKGIIGAVTMKPLLERKNTEFLINLMYDFANRAANIEKHEPDMIELLGTRLSYAGTESVSQRQQKFLTLYRNNTNTVYHGRSAYVSINRPGTTKLLYFLVYFTRHPKGIIVFMEAAEKMMLAQRTTHQEVLILKQFKAAPMEDLFATDDSKTQCGYTLDNRYSAREFLLTKLSRLPLLIDNECWASFLEESNLYPTDFQLAMKELLKEKRVENMDEDVSRRRTRFVQPDWPSKSERWRLLC